MQSRECLNVESNILHSFFIQFLASEWNWERKDCILAPGCCSAAWSSGGDRCWLDISLLTAGIKVVFCNREVNNSVALNVAVRPELCLNIRGEN